MTLLLNLWGGPGIGKSTTAAGVFSGLKQRGVRAEYVQEYAKDLTWEHDSARLTNQLLITGEQIQRTKRLLNQVQVIVTDSPVMLGCMYTTCKATQEAIREQYKYHFDGHTSLDILLKRKKAWSCIGRNQTYDEAVEIDKRLAAQFASNPPSSVWALDGGTQETIDTISRRVAKWVNNDGS